MLTFISFIIKIILAGVFAGFCRYKRNGESRGKDVIRTSLIGIVAASSIAFAISIGETISGTLVGAGMIGSLFLVYILLKEHSSKPGIREIIALQIGWFTGAGKIGHALVLLLFLIIILNQLNSITENSEPAPETEIDSN